MDDREQAARTAVKSVVHSKKLEPLFSKDGNRRFFREALAMQTPQYLVKAAREGSSDAIDLLKEYGRKARDEGREVPRELWEFVFEWFLDGKPAAPRGTSTMETDLRKQTIAVLVRVVHEQFGFPVYANSEHRGNPDGPMTAPRLVGEEIGLSKRTVEDIYEECKGTGAFSVAHQEYREIKI
jgi:hypothetical protein